jgi:rhodanese-related sulfurtransferase
MAKNALASYFATKIEAEWGPYDLKHALESNPGKIVVLDTRTPDAFAEEHIKGAINIPEAELDKRLKELPKNKEVVPYCWNITCHLATRVALKLAQKGYRVHELAGGIANWKASDFPVTSAKKEPASVA